MKTIELNERTSYEVKAVVVPFADEILEITVNGESYRIINPCLGIAVNTRNGEHVILEMEEGILSLAS